MPDWIPLLQGNLPQLLKWTPEGQRTAANIYSDLTREVADEADLILWPETALPMIDSQARPVLERVQANLPPEAALLTGIVQLDENNRYFNSVIGVGDVEGSYQKEHRVPFGEYLPLESLLAGTIAVAPAVFSGLVAATGGYGAGFALTGLVAGLRAVGLVRARGDGALRRRRDRGG